MALASFLFGAFFIMMFAGVPIAASLGLAGTLAIATGKLGIMAFPTNVYAGIAKYPLLAIPMFVLAGAIFDKAGVAYPTADWTLDDLMAAARKLTVKGVTKEVKVPVSLTYLADKLGAVGVESDPDVAKVSIIGVGMRTPSGPTSTTKFETSKRAGPSSSRSRSSTASWSGSSAQSRACETTVRLAPQWLQ